MAGGHIPRKGKREHGGGPEKGTPKKGHTDKFCKWCKAVDGPFTTHNTDECLRFNKDGSQKDRPTKPFDSARGSGGKNVIFSNCPYDKSEYSDPLIYIPI
jgi:hypothetical protein